MFELRFPELSFLVFKVFSRTPVKHYEIGQSAAPVFYISKGFRVLELLDTSLETINNTFLLLKIDITTNL